MRILVFGFCVGLAGCTRAPLEGPAPAPNPVTVSYPVARDVEETGVGRVRFLV
jgi:hypothetical protein